MKKRASKHSGEKKNPHRKERRNKISFGKQEIKSRLCQNTSYIRKLIAVEFRN